MKSPIMSSLRPKKNDCNPGLFFMSNTTTTMDNTSATVTAGEQTLAETVNHLTSALASVSNMLAKYSDRIEELTKERDALLLRVQPTTSAKATPIPTSKTSYTLQDISDALVIPQSKIIPCVSKNIPPSFYQNDLFQYTLNMIALQLKGLKFDIIVCYEKDREFYRRLAYYMRGSLNAIESRLNTIENITPPYMKGKRVLVANYRCAGGSELIELSNKVREAGGEVVETFSFITIVGHDRHKPEFNLTNHATLLCYDSLTVKENSPVVNFNKYGTESAEHCHYRIKYEALEKEAHTATHLP